MTDETTSTRIDPVCGMTVELADAEAAGLVTEHEGQSYAFCGRGCLLDFKDDPATFLDPAHTPSM